MIIEVLFAVLAMTVALNAWATLRILRDDLLEPVQKLAQCFLVWVVPVLGAFVALHLQRRDVERSSGRYTEAPDVGDDFGRSVAPKSRFGEVIDGDS